MVNRFFNLSGSKIIFRIWAAFDIFYILSYIMNSLRKDKVPYVTDFLLTVDNLLNHGGVVTGGMIIFSWILQLSIIFSAILLFLNSSKAKLLCYMQTPLRLIFMVPSISAITYFSDSFYGVEIFFILLLVIEGIKVYSIAIAKRS